MRLTLFPVIVLFVLPALYLGGRAGLFSSATGKWIGGGLAAIAVVAAAPAGGADLATLKELALFLAAAFAVLFLLAGYRVPWTLHGRRFSAALVAATALSALVYLNFFAFHGNGQYVHLHDAAHYYLGSKYYGELGYRDLYTALLAAEAEDSGGRLVAADARDLTTYEVVGSEVLLAEAGRVKAAFSEARWGGFRRDAALFRERLGEDYSRLLLDHGFNPTPVWALIGGALAERVPAGSYRGVLALTLLDLLLWVGLFGAVAWAFGGRAMVLGIAHFTLVFGATFGWTGGSFLRYLWLFALGVAFCCYRRHRHAWAGALLALSAALRVFPALFVVPLALKAVDVVRRRRRLPRRYRSFFAGLAATGVLLFALTATLPRGLDHWREFTDNMTLHVGVFAPNVVGLNELLSSPHAPRPETAEDFAALTARKQTIHRAQLVLVFLPLLVWVARAAPRRSDLGAMLLALPLLFAGLSLASYYYVFLILLVIVYHRAPRALALIFTVEAASYAFLLFENSNGWLYLYRGLLVTFLYLSLYLFRQDGREDAREQLFRENLPEPQTIEPEGT